MLRFFRIQGGCQTQGKDGNLFADKPDDFRWAVRVPPLRRAAHDANDLRRTYATELHSSGARLATLAPTMGHADTRMFERVYAVLPPAVIAERLQIELGLHRDRIGTDASAQAGNAGTPGTDLPPEKPAR